MIGIPRWPLNSADRIANNFQKVENQAVNQHISVREVSEQIYWVVKKLPFDWECQFETSGDRSDTRDIRFS
jgi:hypothetical protein